MDITREQIEDEKDYKALQEIGKGFETEGHEVKLNAKTVDLRVELLAIFDEHYAEGGVESEPETETEGEEEVELGADETEGEEEQPDETPDEPEAEAEVEAEVPAEQDATPEPEEEEEKPKEQLYIARRGMHRVWIAPDEYEEFLPGVPRPLPKKLNKDAQARLNDAIKMKRIIKFED